MGRLVVLLGVLGVLTLCCLGIAAGLRSLAAEPNEIRAVLDPARVTAAAGETFTVTLTIENVSLDAVRVTAIGLDEALGDVLRVEATDPAFRGTRARSYPLLGAWEEYALDQRVFAGEKLPISLTLTALQPGNVSGEVTVWVQDKLLGVSFERARRATLNVAVR
ncbi:MAG: hypothetical protein M5U29_03770 [Anaerolineae bacterium]|nr:hypothetical protein [Anaerolineae bacterium]